MTKIKLDILLGRSKAGLYDSRSNPVADDVRKKLTEALRGQVFALGRDAAEKKVAAMEVAIVDALERDLLMFARTASAFFFRRSASERPLVISPPASFALRESAPSSGGRRAVSWKHREFKDGNLYWPGLAASTLKRKRRTGVGASTYFIFNNILSQEMATAFGGIIGELFAPSVTFTRAADRDIKTGRFVKGTSVGKIVVRIFQSSADSGTFRDAMVSGSWGAASDDTALITRYLSALTAAKLNNYAKTAGGGRENIKRPWIGPSIAFWLIHRMPTVIENSIRASIKSVKNG